MLIKTNFKIVFKIIKASFLKQKIPLFISWNITNRCNYRCKYCSIWSKAANELNTDEVISLVNNFSECGTEAISFSGGEPLLRDDIGDIISHCRRKGIYTKLTTNGSLIPRKITEIRDIGLVKITFNGPKCIHDSQRQEGSYEDVLNAVELVKKNNIDVGLNCVISKHNIDYLDFILETAKRLKVKVSFQPLEQRGSFNKYVDSGFPEPEKIKMAISKLIELKRNRNSCIANSLTGLKYLYNWPSAPKIKCWAGQLYFRITSEGLFTVCERVKNINSAVLNLRSDIKMIMNSMSFVPCQEKCWRNTTIELNCLLSFNPTALLNVNNILCKR